MLSFYFDMDGTLCEWKPVRDFSVLYQPGYFLNLKPQENVVNLLLSLLDRGYSISILSAILGTQQEAEKRIWLGRVFGDRRPEIKTIFVPNGANKGKYVSVSPETILLDDYSLNLLKWREAGGAAIKVLNGINGAGNKWSGARLNAMEPISVSEVLARAASERIVLSKQRKLNFGIASV